MTTMASADESLVCQLDDGRTAAEPCVLVILGASGDLTARKLIPALSRLHDRGALPAPFQIVGLARRTKSDEAWRAELRETVAALPAHSSLPAASWDSFAARLSYCTGDLTDPAAFGRLASHIRERAQMPWARRILFYLATSPSQFSPIVENLCRAGLLERGRSPEAWQRVVVEKPFGHDRPSAATLNAELLRFIDETQIFRIDHYLGKETVQNILMFRFSNAIFEQIWSRESIDHVQITVSEKAGVGPRGGYYEEAGALRDMVQNHLLQVLALIAMEPPVSLDAEAIRDEKTKLLRSIRRIPPAAVARQVVRGQYAAGAIDGQARPAYRQEPRVAPDSSVETYVAIELFIDTWRWADVPFYLRTGKNLPLNASEVRIQFRAPPRVLFAAQCGPLLDANAFTLRLQPDEGISLRFNGKIPGTALRLRPVRMHFSYHTEFQAYTPEAYERLLLDALAGDATLFIRRDEVEAAWAIVDPIRAAWNGIPLADAEFYPAGAWGPRAAEELLARQGRAWRNPQPV